MPQYLRAFLGAQPIAGAKSELLDALHAADACGQFGTQQARIGCFVRQPSNSGQLLVDGVRRQTSGFQVHAVANYHNAVECQSWFGAIPGDELIDRILVHAARGWRTEAVKHGPLAMIQIRQAKQPATVIRLDSLFAHSHGLLMPQAWEYGRRVGQCKSLIRGCRVLSVMAWFRQLTNDKSEIGHF